MSKMRKYIGSLWISWHILWKLGQGQVDRCAASPSLHMSGNWVQHTQGNFRNLDSLTPKSAVRINGHMKLVINFPLFVQKKTVALPASDQSQIRISILTAVWLVFEKDHKTKLLERTWRGQTQTEGSKALYFKFFGQQNNSKLTILSSCIINSQMYHKAIKVP